MRIPLFIGVLACSASLAALADDPPKSAPSRDNGSVQYAGRTRVRLGGIYVGAGYSRYSGPYYGYPFGYYPAYWAGPWSPYYWPFWDLYLPMYYPGFYPPYYSRVAGPNMGEVKLRAEPREAEVYINGAYAGVVSELKNIWLEPGAYDLEVRSGSREPFSRRIYVLSGKTLRIDATLQAEKKP